MQTNNLKKMPPLYTDEEAEAFLENEDLSEYDWSDLKRVKFEFVPKREKISLDLPEKLLDAVKTKASEKNITYAQFIEQALEQAVS